MSGRQKTARLEARYKPKTCKRCGKTYTPVTGQQKYCRRCGVYLNSHPEERRRLSAERKRNPVTGQRLSQA
jgi:predicted amidophosphoribosyltransferase